MDNSVENGQESCESQEEWLELQAGGEMQNGIQLFEDNSFWDQEGGFGVLNFCFKPNNGNYEYPSYFIDPTNIKNGTAFSRLSDRQKLTLDIDSIEVTEVDDKGRGKVAKINVKIEDTCSSLLWRATLGLPEKLKSLFT
jgi:hypothetical protein